MLPIQPAGLAPGQTLELDQNIEYSSWGWIDMLSRALVWFMGGIDSVFGSYGLSVILLTVLVKLCMFPISRKTVVSMEKMKLLQPYMAALKKLYEGKTDQASKQKMSQEMMALYRMNKASPFGSSGPMLVTIPVFLALYNAFWANYDMRHVGFLGFISDLCEPDRVFPIYLDHLWNWLPRWFNLMPALYLALNYAQLQLAPQVPTDPSQNQMKFMTRLMPLMMFMFFYNMPSGLVLYFVASMIYGIAENWLIRRYFYRPVPVEAPAHLKKMAEKMATDAKATAQSAGLSMAARG
jgi:YidC/Oxa1 family membrane protein insertase